MPADWLRSMLHYLEAHGSAALASLMYERLSGCTEKAAITDCP